MSASRVVPVTCPACRHAQDFTLWEFLEVKDAPGQKHELLSGALTRMTCTHCGAETDVVYPLLYHDAEFRLLLRLFPGAGKPDEHEHRLSDVDAALAAGHQFRLVRTLNDLKEKVVIAECGLDDRVVEIFKIALREDPDSGIRDADVLLFSGIEQDRAGTVLVFTVLRDGERLEFSADFDVYAKFAGEAEATAESLFAGDELWIEVDAATTRARFHERGDDTD